MASIKKAFWYFLQFLALLLLAGAVPMGMLFRAGGIGWLVFAAILLLHTGELWVTVPLARQRGLILGPVIARTLLFGFTWWLPWKTGS